MESLLILCYSALSWPIALGGSLARLDGATDRPLDNQGILRYLGIDNTPAAAKDSRRPSDHRRGLLGSKAKIPHNPGICSKEMEGPIAHIGFTIRKANKETLNSTGNLSLEIRRVEKGRGERALLSIKTSECVAIESSGGGQLIDIEAAIASRLALLSCIHHASAALDGGKDESKSGNS
jgi:hypothetical protein